MSVPKIIFHKLLSLFTGHFLVASVSRSRSNSFSKSRSNSISRSRSNSLFPESLPKDESISKLEMKPKATEENPKKLEEYFDSICITDGDKTSTKEGKGSPDIPVISLNDVTQDLLGGEEGDEEVIFWSKQLAVTSVAGHC